VKVLSFFLSGQFLANSVGAIVNLDPHEGPIEDQTQHPQELEHKVPEGTTFTSRIITVNSGEVISSIFIIGRCTNLTKISCSNYIYFLYNCND
jgi:hypothetical protein